MKKVIKRAWGFSSEFLLNNLCENVLFRGGSRTAATSKMERFVIIVNSFQPLTIITKRPILDVAVVLDPPLLFQRRIQLCQTYKMEVHGKSNAAVIQFPADLVTFTAEILNGKLHFMCSVKTVFAKNLIVDVLQGF